MAVTLCPIAIAVGCRRCPVFRVCPLKRVIGDEPAAPEASSAPDAPTVRRKGRTRGKPKRSAARRK
ncbi:MAG: hypothetical protein AMXMBFR42_32090 [Burkholderiales bacterium]